MPLSAGSFCLWSSRRKLLWMRPDTPRTAAIAVYVSSAHLFALQTPLSAPNRAFLQPHRPMASMASCSRPGASRNDAWVTAAFLEEPTLAHWLLRRPRTWPAASERVSALAPCPTTQEPSPRQQFGAHHACPGAAWSSGGVLAACIEAHAAAAALAAASCTRGRGGVALMTAKPARARKGSLKRC